MRDTDSLLASAIRAGEASADQLILHARAAARLRQRIIRALILLNKGKTEAAHRVLSEALDEDRATGRY